MKNLNDAELFDLLKTDEKAAVANAYLQYAQPLRALAYKCLGNRQDVDDVLQEVFMDFMVRKPFHRIRTTVKKYLLGAAWNQSKALLRTRIDEQQKNRDYVFVEGVQQTQSQIRLERMLWLETKLEEITDPHQKDILDAIIDGQESYAEIADRLNCTQDHVQYVRQKYANKLKPKK